jgi:alkylation response protein AidB-like acyl-CoA dehydrogenase
LGRPEPIGSASFSPPARQERDNWRSLPGDMFEVKDMQIFGGTNQIQRMVIGRRLAAQQGRG